MKINKNIKNIKNQKGFTLLETLIAIFILTLSITGPVYIASLSFRNTIESRDNISAQYIAEEVIEVIRNQKDKQLLSSSDMTIWLNSFADCINVDSLDSVSNKCIMQRDVDSDIDYVFDKCINECTPISFDPNGNDAVYGKINATDVSKFTREFYIETKSSNEGEAVVTVNIKWTDKGRDKIYTLKERIYAVNYTNFFK